LGLKILKERVNTKGRKRKAKVYKEKKILNV